MSQSVSRSLFAESASHVARPKDRDSLEKYRKEAKRRERDSHAMAALGDLLAELDYPERTWAYAVTMYGLSEGSYREFELADYCLGRKLRQERGRGAKQESVEKRAQRARAGWNEYSEPLGLSHWIEATPGDYRPREGKREVTRYRVRLAGIVREVLARAEEILEAGEVRWSEDECQRITERREAIRAAARAYAGTVREAGEKASSTSALEREARDSTSRRIKYVATHARKAVELAATEAVRLAQERQTRERTGEAIDLGDAPEHLPAAADLAELEREARRLARRRVVLAAAGAGYQGEGDSSEREAADLIDSTMALLAVIERRGLADGLLEEMARQTPGVVDKTVRYLFIHSGQEKPASEEPQDGGGGHACPPIEAATLERPTHTDCDAIPDELKRERRWVVWNYLPDEKGGKPRKVPFQPEAPRCGASSTNPDHWSSFERAREVCERGGFAGLMFALGDGFAGVDLDSVISEGQLGEAAQNIVCRIDSYTEVSPSGTGVKAIVRGTLPEGGRKRGQIEMYCESRFFTVTGAHLPGTRATVQERTPELAALHREVWPEQYERQSATSSSAASAEGLAYFGDEEILERAQKAMGSGARFTRLWAGDKREFSNAAQPEGDHSAADLALCDLLAGWTRDPSQIERLFRRSGLWRRKWERDDYRRRTIGKALAGDDSAYRHRVEREKAWRKRAERRGGRRAYAAVAPSPALKEIRI